MSNQLITTAYPATLPEFGYARASEQHRPWYVVYRADRDVVGVTATLLDGDEIIVICQPEGDDG